MSVQNVLGYCVAAVSSIIVTACGGGGGSGTGTTTPTVVNQSVGGIWTGTVPLGSTQVPVTMLSTEGGQFFYTTVDSQDDEVVFLGNLSAAGNAVTGTAEAVTYVRG